MIIAGPGCWEFRLAYAIVRNKVDADIQRAEMVQVVGNWHTLEVFGLQNPVRLAASFTGDDNVVTIQLAGGVL